MKDYRYIPLSPDKLVHGHHIPGFLVESICEYTRDVNRDFNHSSRSQGFISFNYTLSFTTNTIGKLVDPPIYFHLHTNDGISSLSLNESFPALMELMEDEHVPVHIKKDLERRDKFERGGAKEELMARVWHPRNMHNFKYLDPEIYE